MIKFNQSEWTPFDESGPCTVDTFDQRFLVDRKWKITTWFFNASMRFVQYPDDDKITVSRFVCYNYTVGKPFYRLAERTFSRFHWWLAHFIGPIFITEEHLTRQEIKKKYGYSI